jgi:hypothetical protein
VVFGVTVSAEFLEASLIVLRISSTDNWLLKGAGLLPLVVPRA